MIRRLGLAAVIAALAAPMLMPGEAMAQRRAQTPSREELGGGITPIPVPQQEKNFPLGASWSLVALNGKPVQDRRATLIVDQNLRGTGFGGCNTFSASAYPLRQQAFAVGPIAVTKMACDKGASAFERSYLIALRTARQWDLVEGRLVLKTGAGEIRFDRGI